MSKIDIQKLKEKVERLDRTYNNFIKELKKNHTIALLFSQKMWTINSKR